MRLYFGGAEIQSHRTLLEEAGAQHQAMSYMGLRRRIKFVKPWIIADRFPSYVSVFLDSGAYTVNANEDATPKDVEEINEHYLDFVNANLDRVDLVSEFDAMVMGLDWIEEQREDFWNKIPREKFMAVWHPVWGLPYLNELASRYEVIGIPSTSMEGRNLRPHLNALAVKGTRIHGIAMTRMAEMQSIRWSSVASMSWISPQRFGDTIVWTGNQLKRYPKKYKEEARTKHRTLFKEMDLDPEAIANDDPSEVLRLSIKSWLKFEEYINRHHQNGGVVTPLFSDRETPEVETDPIVVDHQGSEDDNVVATPPPSKAVAKPREATHILPVMGLDRSEDDEGNPGPPTLHIRSESARVCNSCFLAQKCPLYEEDSNCGYNIPVTIRTREQRKALHEGLIEMQTQRVLFMRFTEEIEGGYADPNLTKEMNLLNKMLAEFAAMEREGFSVTFSASGSGPQAAEAGMFTRIFGDKTGQQVQQIEGPPVDADAYIKADVVDGEVIESE